MVFVACLVDVHVFVFDVIVFQVFFGHFAPGACAYGVKEDFVCVVFSFNFGFLHSLTRCFVLGIFVV